MGCQYWNAFAEIDFNKEKNYEGKQRVRSDVLIARCMYLHNVRDYYSLILRMSRDLGACFFHNGFC
jgi:hypothetical protein